MNEWMNEWLYIKPTIKTTYEKIRQHKNNSVQKGVGQGSWCRQTITTTTTTTKAIIITSLLYAVM